MNIPIERKRDRVAAKIAKLDAQILAAGGRPGRPGRRRRRNAVPLRDALALALKGKKMTVTEAAQAVVRAGYQSGSPNFIKVVNAQLLDKKRFKRMGRGGLRGEVIGQASPPNTLTCLSAERHHVTHTPPMSVEQMHRLRRTRNASFC